jgi:hypothetical protein
MKPNVPLIICAALVFGIGGCFLSKANDDMPLRLKPEKYGYEAPCALLGILMAVALSGYVAGREDESS